jgi:hypothetical protein
VLLKRQQEGLRDGHLKVPKHENFILVDFRDFFTKQTPWDSDPVDMILKIICNGQALMYRV